MGKKPVISLRIYRGKQMSYDAQGNVQNENQLVKLVHDTKEWTNFMKNLISNGYLKVDVEDVKIVEKQKDEDGFIVDKISQYDNKILIIKEVDEVFKSHTTVPMSASDKKIADLEAKIDALLKIQEEAVIVKKPKVPKKETTTKVDKVDKKMMDNLRIDYADLNQGRKAFPGWDEVTLRGKIEELKKNQD